ncbi:T9SS type A sorting domain-containing protein [bacterium]|nr:T9SS type A sorting domain-containing protein [bacterium]
MQFFRKAALFATLLMLFVVATVFAAKPPADKPVHLQSDQALMRPDAVKIGNKRVSTETGVTYAWYRLNIPTSSLNPEDAAREFLLGHADEFGGIGAVSGLETIAVKENPWSRHVHLQHTVDGIPVYRSRFTVSMDDNGMVTFVTANPYPNFTLPGTSPAISATEAVSLSRTQLNGSGPEIGEVRTELVGYRDNKGMDHLAWKVAITTMDPMGDWELLWDAGDGTFLEAVDRMVYEDGTGMVFYPDPLTSAGTSYGGNYGDNSDGDTAELNNERVSMTLQDLTESGGVYHLDGPYVDLLDFEPPTFAPVTNADPDAFNYTRSQQGFEDVNVYYHIDTAQRWFQELGFTNIQNGPIEADPHGLNGSDNSHYIPSQNRLAFGEGGVDDAEDADVIWHEYGHAVQHDASPSWSGGETSDMGEGLSDYWAATFSARISDYNDHWVFNWDGHNPFWGGRVVNSTQGYSSWVSGGSIYANGTLWAGALWEMHGELGYEVMDAIVLQHHFYLGWGASVLDGAEAVLEADQDLFDGEHIETIAQVLYDRGFIDEMPVFGNVEGVVLDGNDQSPIEGAVVTLAELEPVTTDATGEFGFYDVPVGTYQITVEHADYLTYTEEIEIPANETLELTIEMVQPQLTVDPSFLDLEMEIGTTITSDITLTNEGNSDTEWWMRLRPDGQAPVERWVETTSIDLYDLIGTDRFFGVAAVNGDFVLTGMGANGNPNSFYVVSAGGTLLNQFDQPSSSGFGFRDLTVADNLLYTSEGESIHVIDMNGDIVETLDSPDGMSMARGIAYDKDNDWLWCADMTSDIVAIDLQGVEQVRFENNLRITGLGYEPFERNGYRLKIYSSDGNPSRVLVSKMNTETGEIAEEIRFDEHDDDVLNGGEVVRRVFGHENTWLSAQVVTRNDAAFLKVYTLETDVWYMDASYRRGVLPAGEDREIELHFNAAGMMEGDYGGFVEMIPFGVETGATVDYDLEVMSVGADEKSTIPQVFQVRGAYPNPFNPSTAWQVQLPKEGPLQMAVYDLLGREVDQLSWNTLQSGRHTVSWTAPNTLAAGVYFARFQFGEEESITHKILLMK